MAPLPVAQVGQGGSGQGGGGGGGEGVNQCRREATLRDPAIGSWRHQSTPGSAEPAKWGEARYKLALAPDRWATGEGGGLRNCTNYVHLSFSRC